MMNNVHPHPEWKRLFAATKEVLAHDQSWSYAELNDLAGVDIRTSRGRNQFQRYRKEVLIVLDLHFENERTKGYRVVRAGEHLGCSLNRTRRAKRQLANSTQILSHVHIQQLTDTERKLNADALARTMHLLGETGKTHRIIRKNVVAIQRGEMPPRQILGDKS